MKQAAISVPLELNKGSHTLTGTAASQTLQLKSNTTMVNVIIEGAGVYFANAPAVGPQDSAWGAFLPAGASASLTVSTARDLSYIGDGATIYMAEY